MNDNIGRRFGVGLVVLVCGVAWGFAQQAPADPAPAASPAPATAPAVPMVEKMTIVCDGKAKTDGKVEFRFTPQGGAATTIAITLQKGMSKRDACRDIAKEVGVVLGSKFKVEHYDDDKVRIEGKEHAQFALSLGGLTVTGTSVQLK